MSKPLSYSFISYDEYRNDLKSMSGCDSSLHKSFAYDAKGMNSTEQMFATLYNVFADEPTTVYDTLAKDKNVTGMAHNLSYK